MSPRPPEVLLAIVVGMWVSGMQYKGNRAWRDAWKRGILPLGRMSCFRLGP